MTITIDYKDNSKRVIKPSSEIYSRTKGELSIDRKIESLGFAWGDPKYIHAVEGDRVIFSRKY